MIMEQKSSWYPANIKTIRETITSRSQSSGTVPPVAVFDFDNTCIFRDIGQAVFRYQLLNLRFKLDPDTFASLLPGTPDQLDGRPTGLICDKLTTLYQQLWPAIQQEQFAAARNHPSYTPFTTLFLWFVDQARKENQLGPRYVLPLLAKLFAGFSITELESLTGEVIQQVTQEPLITEHVAGGLAPPVGQFTTSYEKGLRPYKEMQELFQWLGEQGVECCVISASTDWLVKVTADTLRYAIKPDNIYGIRTTVESEILQPSELPDYPVTFREGKAEVIRKFIGTTPILVAGDADTDYEMLTLDDVALRLIINRNQKGAIGSLYNDPRYLLQGIDPLTGSFRPTRETL